MENIYQPIPAKIVRIEEQSHNVKLFRIKKQRGKFEKNSDGLVFTPGQFILLGLWGYGEAPFGIASPPNENKFIEVAVRRAGMLTEALHRLEEGDDLTLRGPYGNGFPLKFFEKRDLVLITGGCGIPPIASLIEYIIKNRENFGRVYLLYGAATPDDILIKDRIKQWEKSIKVLLTVDKPTPEWKGYTGLVGEIVDEMKINPLNAAAAMCGPGPMVAALEKILRPLGISDREIFVSDERRMKCGIGKCQHCTTGDKYVCLDGPVFNYDQIDKNWD